MADSRSNDTKAASALLWQQMRGFRGTYAWAIASLFVFTAINYVTPLVASATIDFALSQKPGADRLTSWIIGLMGGADFVKERLWFPALLMVSLTLVAGGFSYLKGRFAAEASDGIARRLKDRVMFGGDYPLFTYERLLADWRGLGFEQDVLDRVLYRNAQRLFADLKLPAK